MYVESPDGSTGKPFYGYHAGGTSVWHYFDRLYNTWKLNVSGDIIGVTTDGRIGMGTTTPHASALLDLQSSSRGLLLPRMSTTQRTSISNPAKGLVVYDSTESKTYITFGFHLNKF